MIVCLCNSLDEQDLRRMPYGDYLKIKNCGICQEMVLEIMNIDFIKESNKIEGILRDPTESEILAHQTFLSLEKVTVSALVDFVMVITKMAYPLRAGGGMDVYVGDHIPPAGGPRIMALLGALVDQINEGTLTPFEAHQKYETLHPFMDGNGRSGRVLWYWQMMKQEPKSAKAIESLGFLHLWYYKSLGNNR